MMEGGKVTTTIGSGDEIIMAVSLQQDGKILAAGYSHNGANFDFALARYTSSGALDTTFGNGGGKVITPIGSGEDYGCGVALLDAKILVAGFSHNAADFDFALARYNPNGSLNPSFGDGGKMTTPIGSRNDCGCAIAIQPDGRFLVAGESFTGSSYDFALVRYWP
jgi:uncharacterized delta-60 repeat protein